MDPLAGSYFIEKLTDKIERQAVELIEKIDQAGGVVAAIEDGFIQRQIENAAYEYQKEIESGEWIIVGVNSFQIKEESRPPTLRVDPAVETMQVEALSQLKKKRNNDKIQIFLKELVQAAQTDANLFPYVFAVVKEYATLGEICKVPRHVFGEYKQH